MKLLIIPEEEEEESWCRDSRVGEIGGRDPALSTLFTRVGIGGVCAHEGERATLGACEGNEVRKSQ